MPFQSKAQMRMLFAAKPAVAQKFAAASKGQNNANLPQHVGNSSSGGNPLAGAAKRKLANLKKSGGSKGGLPHPLDTAAIDQKEAQMRAQQNGNN